MESHATKTLVVVAAIAVIPLCVEAAGSDPNRAASATRIDYVARLNDSVRKDAAPNRNAEPFYAKAVELYVESPTQSDANDIRLWPTQLPPEQLAERRRWVESNSSALAQLTLGTQQPAYGFRYQGDTIWNAVNAIPISRWRKLVFALQSRAKIRAIDGDTGGAMEDVTVGYRFGCDLRKRMLLVEQLVGCAAQELSLATAFQVLDYAETPPGLLQSFQKRMAESLETAPARDTLMGEKFLVLDSIQSVYGTMIGPRNRPLDEEAAATLAIHVLGITSTMLTREQILSSLSRSTPPEMAQQIETHYAYYENIVSRTPFQWQREGIDASFRKHRDELQNTNVLLSTLLPAVERAAYLAAFTRVQADALIAATALLRYRIDHAIYPPDLKTLVAAGYLAAVPPDPFGDGPVVYKRTRNDFILYIRGLDGDDDGGKHVRDGGTARGDGDYVFWPVQPLSR
jgi:hypothetical protein